MVQNLPTNFIKDDSMATGYFLRIGDKTTCGGSILSGSPNHSFGGIATARNGDSVSCGKDSKIYHIAGGIPTYSIHGVAAAGTLYSRSTCPCNASFISSFPNASYWDEEKKAVRAAPVTTPSVAAVPTNAPARVAETEQHAQAAKKKNNFAETCGSEDYALSNGVYLWTESTGAGHVFVSVHDSNDVYLYTYGRYGRTDQSTLTGDGILDFFQGEDARKYYRYELYEMGARVFRIADASQSKTRQYFENLWNNGTPPVQTSNMQDGTKQRGHTIDKYDVTGSNCTTHSVEGIKFAGSKIFDSGYRSITTQLPIESEEDFTVPVSLQRYLITKGSQFSPITVAEMTCIFKNIYPNIENKSPQPMGGSAKIQQVGADSAAVTGSTSPYSGGTVGGSLGSTYDDQ
jgi:uncharacterized Zn-binding protein involved in type VI secretion